MLDMRFSAVEGYRVVSSEVLEEHLEEVLNALPKESAERVKKLWDSKELTVTILGNPPSR